MWCAIMSNQGGCGIMWRVIMSNVEGYRRATLEDAKRNFVEPIEIYPNFEV